MGTLVVSLHITLVYPLSLQDRDKEENHKQKRGFKLKVTVRKLKVYIYQLCQRY